MKMPSDKIQIKTSLGIPLKCPSIKFCWEIDLSLSPNEAFVQNVLPSLYIDMIFPLSGGLLIDSDLQLVKQPFISPILQQKKSVFFSRGSKIFGIRITPTFAGIVLGTPLNILEQGPNWLCEALPSKLNGQIQEIINNNQDFIKRVKLIDGLFSRISLVNNRQTELLDISLKKIASSPECRLKDLVELTGYSARWIEKLTQLQFGATPGQLISISRLNRFIGLAKSSPALKLTQLALESGYYDQAHLIRDLKKYVDIRPKVFRNNLPEFVKIMNHL